MSMIKLIFLKNFSNEYIKNAAIATFLTSMFFIFLKKN